MGKIDKGRWNFGYKETVLFTEGRGQGGGYSSEKVHRGQDGDYLSEKVPRGQGGCYSSEKVPRGQGGGYS
jgi:hypothetical protein